jgi:tripartite-type tricarboxylate transporter receptor subunit TctC
VSTRRKQSEAQTVLTRLLVAVAVLAGLPNFANADPVSDFYEGKQIRFIIRAAPGGNYDLYMRLLARHIVRHIPENRPRYRSTCPAAAG